MVFRILIMRWTALKIFLSPLSSEQSRPSAFESWLQYSSSQSFHSWCLYRAKQQVKARIRPPS
jgi:hypothetical protein